MHIHVQTDCDKLMKRKKNSSCVKVLLAKLKVCWWSVLMRGASTWLACPLKHVVQNVKQTIPGHKVIVDEIHEIISVGDVFDNLLGACAGLVQLGPVCVPQCKRLVLGEWVEEWEELVWLSIIMGNKFKIGMSGNIWPPVVLKNRFGQSNGGFTTRNASLCGGLSHACDLRRNRLESYSCDSVTQHCCVHSCVYIVMWTRLINSLWTTLTVSKFDISFWES